MTDIFASVDLGGTKIACALATAQGQILVQKTAPTHAHDGPAAVLMRIAALVNDLASEVGQRPASLGMGVPGLADIETGDVLFLPNLPTQWRGVPAASTLQPLIGCPIYLLNDVRLATLGELVFGHGRTEGNLIFFAVGTGIGGGFTIDGKLFLGPMGASAEFGHMTVVPDGPACSCGSQGCLETYAGGPAITAQGVRLLLAGQTTRLYEIVGGNPAAVTPREMARAAAEGDEGVRTVLVRAAEYLGIGVANVVSVLHPGLVVLGGGVAEIGDLLFDTVRATIRRRVGAFPTGDIDVVPSQLGVNAGLLGGIALAARIGV